MIFCVHNIRKSVSYRNEVYRYTKQFKIVLLTEHSEITLNVITTSIDFEIIVNSLIFRTSNKIKLELIENGNYTNLKLT